MAYKSLEISFIDKFEIKAHALQSDGATELYNVQNV